MAAADPWSAGTAPAGLVSGRAPVGQLNKP